MTCGGSSLHLFVLADCSGSENIALWHESSQRCPFCELLIPQAKVQERRRERASKAWKFLYVQIDLTSDLEGWSKEKKKSQKKSIRKICPTQGAGKACIAACKLGSFALFS
jgi:hypothetical protein